MRKVIFIFFIVTGATVGVFSAWDGDWGLRVVMMTLGAVVGIVIGGGLARMGRKAKLTWKDENVIPGLGTTTEDLAANFWRDKGHPPFMKPPKGEHGRRVFDPRNLD